MDKETLSNYGWIVIAVLVLAVMIALATPFGEFVANGVKATTQGLFDTNQKALNATGLINIPDQNFDQTNTIPPYNHDAPELHQSGVIPEGGVYYTDAYHDYEQGEDWLFATTLNAGDEFPELKLGDTYEYGGYIYWFGYEMCPDSDSSDYAGYTIDGWHVTYKQGEEHSNILESINGKNVISMNKTFAYKQVTENLIAIPKNVTSLGGAFAYGSLLECKIRIDSNITESYMCFDGINFQEQKITLIGNFEQLDELGETGNYYCTVHNGYCENWCTECFNCGTECGNDCECGKTHMECEHYCRACCMICEYSCSECGTVCDTWCEHKCKGCMAYECQDGCTICGIECYVNCIHRCTTCGILNCDYKCISCSKDHGTCEHYCDGCDGYTCGHVCPTCFKNVNNEECEHYCKICGQFECSHYCSECDAKSNCEHYCSCCDVYFCPSACQICFGSCDGRCVHRNYD